MANFFPQYVYKVVGSNNTSINKYFLSARALHNSLLYKLNEWTVPNIKGSKIFCFKTFSDALSFRSVNEHILLCEAINVESINLYVYSLCDDVESFWQDINSHKNLNYWNQAHNRRLPEGTVGCDAVKPLYMVE